MEKFVCSDCNKEVQSAESLEQHRQAKHTAQPAGAPEKKKSKKGLIIVAVLVVAVILAYFVVAGKSHSGKDGATGDNIPADNFDKKAFAAKIPKGPIHWHPHVTITITEKLVTIPEGLGLSGSVHNPVHTHATDNILHWEVDSPTVDNMQLGYFFNRVWRKTFNSQCIFDSCNGPEGNLTMYVNGVPNNEFDHYMPKDKDEIKIVFE